MNSAPLMLTLTSPEETAKLAVSLAAHLGPGDCILLNGPVGAGKSHFARNLIRSLLLQDEDIPSPTFTLVQTYETRAGELWHADLYRLGTVDEIEELGLTDAFETAICLVEWPDTLGSLTPESALGLQFSPDSHAEETRHLELTWRDPKWYSKLEMLQNA
ncbi:tRNA (adenosine(37)-N6)-threonylcarbamoyltransferase complex ATPase subunit type 1 TsaE [Rhodobacteraceae bacterium F11138]|nr:tRNA (adenosine(37)-N6)-threonylcarbamoyltransferase complex ATPase subunit type 1 TsaE [Rhodobacteraceae bacterium F11138]